MKTWTTYVSSKSIKLVDDIIRTEDLEVTVEYELTTLGDSIIVVSGNTEEVNILEKIYEMVK